MVAWRLLHCQAYQEAYSVAQAIEHLDGIGRNVLLPISDASTLQML